MHGIIPASWMQKKSHWMVGAIGLLMAAGAVFYFTSVPQAVPPASSPQPQMSGAEQGAERGDEPQGENKISDGTEEVEEEAAYQPNGEFTPSFAAYTEIPINANPRIPAYAVNKDLSNVANSADFELTAQVKAMLVKNMFVVRQGSSREFYPLYEKNRYAYTPNFITTDSMLHNYHLMFDYLLEQVEEKKLIAALRWLNARMYAQAVRQYDNLKGTDWENAAKRNVGFFSVGSRLLDPSAAIPEVVKSEVEKELAFISAHRGIDESPVMNMGNAMKGAVYDTPQGELDIEALKEDYSQYLPRGHYDKSDRLKAYFKSMMWYGRLTFRLKNNDEIRSAVLITQALDQEDNKVGWNAVYEPVNFFVGKSDDITYYQFKELIERVYGKDATLASLSGDKDKFGAFVAEAKKLSPPQINSIPVFNAEIQPDREREIKGFRFMGQRFTIDAAIFQRLIDRETPQRMLPKGLDIPAAMGSAEALKILTQMGETKYENYSENMSKMQSYLAGLPEDAWTQNLYWGWMHTLRPFTIAKPVGYPVFMRNPAWARKELNTFLGSWTELKHDTILYAKQVYAEMGGGGPEQKDDRGYVEPNPHVYARLAALLKLTNEGLEARRMITPAMKDDLDKLRTLALSLKTIAEKELNNEALTEQEYELIRSYGGQLEHFWLQVNKDEPQFKESSSARDYLNENPAALVADVATDPNGEVLEEATGYIADIFVVVPVDGKLRIAKGGVYSYYEFPWPMSDRLTDKKWRETLDSSDAPVPPSWTNAFMVK